MRCFNVSSFLATALGACLLTGCGNREFAPVSGTVTYEGKPIADATVTFQPEGEGKTSVGTTGADGTYELTLAGSVDEQVAKVGKHRVTIAAVKIEGGSQGASGASGSLSMGMGRPPKITNLLPPKYADVETSGLTFEVKPSGSNVADFALTK